MADPQHKSNLHGANEDETTRKMNAIRRRSSASVTTLHHVQPPPPEKNTAGFFMRPNLGEKFDRLKVESVMEDVLRGFMKDKPMYVPDAADAWTEELTRMINTQVKDLNFPRYKICTLVTVGEHIGSGIHVGMKCLWDAETDIYANYSYMTDTMFVIGTVCGVFYY